MPSPPHVNAVKAESIPPIPTPHWGPQTGPAFTVRATVRINAPPQPILSALLSTSTWPQWNNFVPRASLSNPPTLPDEPDRLRPGTIFTEHVDMGGRGRATFVKMKLLMTALESLEESGRDGHRVVWLGKSYPRWALRSERVHEIYKVEGEEGSVYDVYETFSGPLAWCVRVCVGRVLVRRFAQWNGELKGFVEMKVGSAGVRMVDFGSN